jgi:hypothetical protein
VVVAEELERLHTAVAGLVVAADLQAVDSAEAEVTLQLRAVQVEAEAVLLLMQAVATRTAVTNLIL